MQVKIHCITSLMCKINRLYLLAVFSYSSFLTRACVVQHLYFMKFENIALKINEIAVNFVQATLFCDKITNPRLLFETFIMLNDIQICGRFL